MMGGGCFGGVYCRWSMVAATMVVGSGFIFIIVKSRGITFWREFLPHDVWFRTRVLMTSDVNPNRYFLDFLDFLLYLSTY